MSSSDIAAVCCGIGLNRRTLPVESCHCHSLDELVEPVEESDKEVVVQYMVTAEADPLSLEGNEEVVDQYMVGCTGGVDGENCEDEPALSSRRRPSWAAARFSSPGWA
jgi:hypothetical protein